MAILWGRGPCGVNWSPGQRTKCPGLGFVRSRARLGPSRLRVRQSPATPAGSARSYAGRAFHYAQRLSSARACVSEARPEERASDLRPRMGPRGRKPNPAGRPAGPTFDAPRTSDHDQKSDAEERNQSHDTPRNSSATFQTRRRGRFTIKAVESAEARAGHNLTTSGRHCLSLGGEPSTDDSSGRHGSDCDRPKPRPTTSRYP